MKSKLALLVIVLIIFASYTAYVFVNHNVLEFNKTLQFDSWSMQILIDLCLAVTLIFFWIVRDALDRGKSLTVPIIYIIISIPTGSIGIFLYLIHRELQLIKEKT